MYRFFKRIFLSVWIISIATMLVTAFAARLLPEATDSKPLFLEQLTQHISQELTRQLQQDPNMTDNEIASRHILDYDNLIKVFIINPEGEDVLGRDLSEYLPLNYEYANDQGLVVIYDEIYDYTVVGYRRSFPFGQVLVKPGARLVLAVTALIISVIVSIALARYVVQPVRHLREAGKRVATGDLTVRVAHQVEGRRDDIALLAQDFDFMTTRIQELLEKQKRLMRDVSHELRSPLARLQALFSLARQKLDKQGGKLDIEHIADMEEESERLNSLIERILVFTRLDSVQEINRHKTDLVDLLQVIAEDAAIEGAEQHKDVLVSGSTHCVMNVDSALLHSAFENVIRNALRYTEPNTNVRVQLKETEEQIDINIVDNGPGVPEQELALLFEPFYRVETARTHKMGEGGIGLAIVERAIKLHGGSVYAENMKSGGLNVHIALPK